MRKHTHWPEGRGPVCRFPTKKACDENWTQFNHGHLGYPCIKEFQPSKSKRGETNKIATCTIIAYPEHGQAFRDALAEQIAQAPPEWRQAAEGAGGKLNASS